MAAAETVSPRLGDVRAAGRMLGLCSRTVQNMVASGRLPAPIRLGRSVRFDLHELNAWISAGCPGAEDWAARRKEGAAR